MPVPPGTSPLSLPIIMLQSTAVQTPGPVPTPLPILKESNTKSKTGKTKEGPAGSQDPFDLPTLRLEIRDLAHPGTKAFLSSVIASTAQEFAVRKVLELLYISPKNPTTKVPGTRSVTLILRSMEGVAYTTGSDIDDDHKEIHLSLKYIDSISKARQADEILGVLTHEMVHCYQYNGNNTCPGGLIEGIADWVRLRANLAPPHWSRSGSGNWDAGYDHTGYFLEYLEIRYGAGTISKMNDKLRTDNYEQKRFWTELLGRPIEQLWGDYGKALEAADTGTANASNEDVEKDDDI
jgi:hypothetical protein